jgi:hypothetical protein
MLVSEANRIARGPGLMLSLQAIRGNSLYSDDVCQAIVPREGAGSLRSSQL